MMIDPASLVFLSIALVSGTADSIPSTEGMLFRASIEPDIVTSFNYKSGGFDLHFKPDVRNQTVTIGLPTGLPVRADMLPQYLYSDCTFPAREYFREMGEEQRAEVRSCAILDHTYEIADCHTFVSVTVNNSVPIYFSTLVARPRYVDPPDPIAPRSELHAKWLGTFGEPPPPRPDPSRIVSAPVPDGCGHVLAWPPLDPPRRQALAEGVLAGSVACNDGLVLRLREGGAGAGAGGNEPLCVRPGTADELVRRGVLESDMPEPRGHRVRP